MHYKPLHLLRPGTQGIVHHYLAGGCATKRLYEMGFIRGEITVVKNDLGGGPCFLRKQDGQAVVWRKNFCSNLSSLSNLDRQAELLEVFPLTRLPLW